MSTPMGQLKTRFNGENFKRWEEKMEYSLRHYDIHYVLTNQPPLIPLENETIKDEIDVVLPASNDWMTIITY